MIQPSTSRAVTTVLILGPSTDQLGGMASVVAQTLALDFGTRFRVQLLANTRRTNPHESAFSRIRRHMRKLSGLRLTIQHSGAKLVHIHTCSGFSLYRSLFDMLTAKQSGCRVVLHIHGAAFDEFYDRSSTIGKRTIRWGLGSADCVIALSNQWHQKLSAIAPEAKIVVVENAVDLPPPFSRTVPGDKCHFALLAKMDTWKGIDDLLDACAGMSSADRSSLDFTLAGPSGSAGDAAVIERKIRERNLENTVRYVGPVRGEEKVKLLRQADAYVQPSHNEGMPISVLEAFSYGLAVVGTTVGAMPEIVAQTGAGVLVSPGRPAELATTLCAIAQNRDSREKFGQTARALAENRFSLPRLRDDLLKIYDGLLKKSY